MRRREPFFGPNAKPFFIQLAVGLALSWGLYELGLWHFGYNLMGYLLNGTWG